MQKNVFQVEFNINQVKRNKELIAVDIQVVQSATQTNGISKQHNNRSSSQVYQGFIAALKDGFGFIETIQHDREVFFHFRSVPVESGDFTFTFISYPQQF